MQQINLQHFLDLDLPFFEPKNLRRGGWSGISRVECAGQVYFVKRQVNYLHREPQRFFLLTPTLRREYRNILRLQNINIGTPEIVLYAEGGRNAMLVTRELKGYITLENFLAKTTGTVARERMFSTLTKTLLKMHEDNFLHGCLYAKHIMVDANEPANIAPIDLEKLRFSIGRRRNACKDISQLLRHTDGIQDSERDLIIATYEQRFAGITGLISQRLHKKVNSNY